MSKEWLDAKLRCNYLKPGNVYTFMNKDSGRIFTGIFLKSDLYKHHGIRGLFNNTYEGFEFEMFDHKSKNKIKTYISTWSLHEMKAIKFIHVTSPALAKQVARGLCDRIPEDCAGIIERMLVGDKIVGKGPDRYAERC